MEKDKKRRSRSKKNAMTSRSCLRLGHPFWMGPATPSDSSKTASLPMAISTLLPGVYGKRFVFISLAPQLGNNSPPFRHPWNLCRRMHLLHLTYARYHRDSPSALSVYQIRAGASTLAFDLTYRLRRTHLSVDASSAPARSLHSPFHQHMPRTGALYSGPVRAGLSTPFLLPP